MRKMEFGKWLLCAGIMASGVMCAQDRLSKNTFAELRLQIVSSQPGKHRAVPAVIWLEAMAGTPALPFQPHGHYTLLQKNRTFIPHLQVIPVGSVVQFPNADPFFHNVFSLFNGTRFDLGLYEAGSSKSVDFPREGVSYIFCNIHPEMSAVVLSLSTPLYSIADGNESFVLRDIPPGDYNLHVWIEGVPQSILDGLGRPVHLSSRIVDLGELKAPILRNRPLTHDNKFGRAYDTDSKSTY
jgi:plastocyanin